MDNVIIKLKAALLARDIAEERALERITSTTDEPSEKFYDELDKRKDELLARTARRTSLIRVAIIAAIIISLTAVVAVAARGNIVDFFDELLEDHLKIGYDRDDDREEIPAHKLPSLIPDGYTLTQNRVMASNLYYTWKNGDLEIVFISTVGGDGFIHISTDGDAYGEVEIGKYKGYYALDGGIYSMSWFDDDRDYMLSVPESLGLEGMMAIAESLVEVEV